MRTLFFLALLTIGSQALLAQSESATPWSTHFWVGYGSFNTHTDFTEEIMTTTSSTSRFTGNIAETVSGISIGIGQSYQLNSRWSAQVVTRFYTGEKYYDKDRSVFINYEPYDYPYAKGEIKSWHVSTFLHYHLTPFDLIQFSIGTGFVGGRYWHRYRDYASYTYEQGNTTITEANYTNVSKKHFGVPLQISSEYSINAHWKVGITAFLNNYLYGKLSLFDGDFERGLNAAVTYQW